MTSPRKLFTSKANKLLAGALTTALALSTGGLTAFAASATPTANVQTVQSASSYSSAPTPILPAPGTGLPPAGSEPLAPPPGPAGIGIGPGLAGIDSEDLLSVLGLSATELRTALEAGSSLRSIAEEQQIDPQKLIQLAASGLQERLSQDYADGRISESVYKERLSEVASRAAAWISQTRTQPPAPGTAPDELPPLGPGMEGLDRSELAELLDLDASGLAASLEDGQSLANLASANGSTAKVIDLVAAALTQDLKERLARGNLWTDQYTAELEDVSTRATELIQHQHQHPLPPHLQQQAQ